MATGSYSRRTADVPEKRRNVRVRKPPKLHGRENRRAAGIRRIVDNRKGQNPVDERVLEPQVILSPMGANQKVDDSKTENLSQLTF